MGVTNNQVTLAVTISPRLLVSMENSQALSEKMVPPVERKGCLAPFRAVSNVPDIFAMPVGGINRRDFAFDLSIPSDLHSAYVELQILVCHGSILSFL